MSYDFSQTYSSDNIFAKIIRGDIPCHKLYEDEVTLAFLDIMPQADGHTLVIPKMGSRNVLDAPVEAFTATMMTAHKISPILTRAMNADGLLIRIANGQASGQVIFHLHVHLIPCWHDVPMRAHTGETASADILSTQADRLRQALAA